MPTEKQERDLWILGLGKRLERGAIICSYLAEGGYRIRTASMPEFEQFPHPFGIILDISPHSDDGWGILLRLKENPETWNIPILPVFLGLNGTIGGVFPIAGFFMLPIDGEHFLERLTVMGFVEDAEVYDLQSLLVTRRGDMAVRDAIFEAGFTPIEAYTGKEALALAITARPYMAFTSYMLPDFSAFELVERFRIYPQIKNMPVFVLLKETMKEGERQAMSRNVEYLVRKKELSKDEFLSYFRNR
ncbi:MAG: response regulator [Desulfuromonadales bacterium]|nr:response regulator [Desulfuromonadales bacterium]